MDINERCSRCLKTESLSYCYRCKYFYCHAHIPGHLYAAQCSECRKIVCLDFYKHRKCLDCDINHLTNDLSQLSFPQTDTLTPLFKLLNLA